MATMGIDPTFSKAYRLLFSDEPDSAEQMRVMLDDALKQKYGTHKSLTSVLPKKLMLEESSSKDHQLSPSPHEHVEDLESEESNNSPDNELSELNILEEDLLCIVCRQMMQSDGNRLVECQECHGLYHQECHQPPINETEIPVNDPRLAWYCAACKKKLNKAISTIKSNKPVVAAPTPPPTPSSPKPSVSAGKPPFTSSKNYSSSTSKTANTASKNAAKVSSPSTSSGSGSTSSKSAKSSHSSKAPIQNMNMISADKRLQMMKKKAAAANKSQDKKK